MPFACNEPCLGADSIAGSAPRQISPPENNRLWIDVAEGFVGGMSLAATSLYPLFHTLRALFGLSLLFYGQEFATLAFHIVVFRLSGWKKVKPCFVPAKHDTIEVVELAML